MTQLINLSWVCVVPAIFLSGQTFCWKRSEKTSVAGYYTTVEIAVVYPVILVVFYLDISDRNGLGIFLFNSEFLAKTFIYLFIYLLIDLLIYLFIYLFFPAWLHFLSDTLKSYIVAVI